MKSFNPDELKDHRAFFTEFDRYVDARHIASESGREAVAVLLERKLKLLLLTKSHVVVAASQLLESPLAHSLFLRHPRLLESGIVVSSLKLGHSSTAEFLDRKREEAATNLNSGYHSVAAREVAELVDSAGTSLRWSLSENSDWFRDRLARDLADDHSLIRNVLRRESLSIPPRLIDQIQAQSGLSRGDVDVLTAAAGNERFQKVIKNYADFIYYVSGARTAKSEGVLPQENLIDFSVSELAEGTTRLSEHEVFFKLFIDIVKARTATIFPTDFLDALSVDDALDLNAVATSRDFTSRYNSIQEKTKDGLQLRDTERLVLSLDELAAFEIQLRNEFDSALDEELPTRFREDRTRAAGDVVHSLTSLAVSWYNADTYRDLFISTLRLTGSDAATNAVERSIDAGLLACERALETMHVLDRQILLDFVDRLKSRYKSKM